MNWLGLLTGLGGLFGGMSSSRDEAKQAQADTALKQYQTEMMGWQVQQQARNTQADQMASRPTERLQQGALGNMVTDWTPSRVSWGGAGTIPQISGGFTDLKFNDMTKQSADLMQRDALLRQMQGGQASDISQIAPMPSAPTMPKKSWLDTLLGLGGLAGGVAGAYQMGQPPTYEDPWKQTGTKR